MSLEYAFNLAPELRPASPAKEGKPGISVKLIQLSYNLEYTNTANFNRLARIAQDKDGHVTCQFRLWLQPSLMSSRD